ncbi:MAG: hypothetical protein HUJ54_13900 [Erysipelotrichaceae bacterium]|nr:hypothetical protein [Erysipelotrichaceae bacterium]
MSDLIEKYAQEIAGEAAEKSRIEGRTEGWIEGRTEGWIEGARENLIRNLQCLMENLKLTLDQAMETLNVSAVEQETIRCLMEKED